MANSIIDLKQRKHLLMDVANSLEKISELQSKVNESLENLIHEHLYTGAELVNESQSAGYIASLNTLILVPWKPFNNKTTHQETASNVNYLKCNQDRFFFVSDKAITEIYLEDTLKVTKHYELIDENPKDFTIELTFKSERVRNREQFIYGNKYRFVWSWDKNKMTVRKLTE